MEATKLKHSDRQAVRRVAHQQAHLIGRRIYEAAVLELERKTVDVGLPHALQPAAVEAAVERALRHVVDTL